MGKSFRPGLPLNRKDGGIGTVPAQLGLSKTLRISSIRKPRNWQGGGVHLSLQLQILLSSGKHLSLRFGGVSPCSHGTDSCFSTGHARTSSILFRAVGGWQTVVLEVTIPPSCDDDVMCRCLVLFAFLSASYRSSQAIQISSRMFRMLAFVPWRTEAKKRPLATAAGVMPLHNVAIVIDSAYTTNFLAYSYICFCPWQRS